MKFHNFEPIIFFPDRAQLRENYTRTPSRAKDFRIDLLNTGYARIRFAYRDTASLYHVDSVARSYRRERELSKHSRHAFIARRSNVKRCGSADSSRAIGSITCGSRYRRFDVGNSRGKKRGRRKKKSKERKEKVTRQTSYRRTLNTASYSSSGGGKGGDGRSEMEARVASSTRFCNAMLLLRDAIHLFDNVVSSIISISRVI